MDADSARSAHQAPRDLEVSDQGSASDADSDFVELQDDIAKFDHSVQAFLASRDEDNVFKSTGNPSRGRGALRGPRKAAEPRGDIKFRLSKVNQAFLNGEYMQARDMVFEIIRINAETHQAWTTLASIFREQGDIERSLMSMVYAAHLRPKDVAGWLKCAAFALDAGQGEDGSDLTTARLCYSAALRADPRNQEARLGKASVCHQQGHIALAITEYSIALSRDPLNIDIIRRLAETCADSKDNTAVTTAIAAYETFFAHGENLHQGRDSKFTWHDVGIYAELFASTGQFREAISNIKSLSRCLLGRQDEMIWNDWEDDREWDRDDERRSQVAKWVSGEHDIYTYGLGLPPDFRARLAMYRLALGDNDEASRHLSWLDPTESVTSKSVLDFPFLIRDVADRLFESGHVSEASDYYQLLRLSVLCQDATVLLQLGRCHLARGDYAAAEESFLSAIEADDGNIEARIELAAIYEKAREEEEALILVTEAIRLQSLGEKTGQGNRSYLSNSASSSLRRSRKRQNNLNENVRPRLPSRYRPKRLVDPAKRLQEEQARANELSKQYKVVQDLKEQIQHGRHDLITEWMAAAKDLVDEFRSFREFYPWDKYLKFLGVGNVTAADKRDQPHPGLAEMVERLSKNLPPVKPGENRALWHYEDDGYNGIPFGDWLELFLDYAISLALTMRGEEAYRVCEAARDSTVFVRSKDYMFLIHVAWSACAIYSGDEEMCVAVARFFMKSPERDSDSYRMFAALCRLCQSPASWYSSGPAQKYILRQIKIMDASHTWTSPTKNSASTHTAVAPPTDEKLLDVCLLMLYGHILFTSASYTFALTYFLRARSLDSTNPMINLSCGLGYIHHGLKRQSENRQYLIIQGLSFIFKFQQSSFADNALNRQEAAFAIGRTFHILGLSHLAFGWYEKVICSALEDPRWDEPNNRDILMMAAYNEYIVLLTGGDIYGAETRILPRLVL